MIKCDPRAIARCPYKRCCGDNPYFMDGSDCDKLNQKVLEPQPTNADRIRVPEIVCLCGPLRFMDAFRQAEYDLEMQGKIVVAPSFLPGALKHDGTTGCTPEEKVMLDELHKRKIDLADRIFVLNVGGYIGDSTRSEIAYAKAHNKPIAYLEPIQQPAEEG